MRPRRREALRNTRRARGRGCTRPGSARMCAGAEGRPGPNLGRKTARVVGANGWRHSRCRDAILCEMVDHDAWTLKAGMSWEQYQSWVTDRLGRHAGCRFQIAPHSELRMPSHGGRFAVHKTLNHYPHLQQIMHSTRVWIQGRNTVRSWNRRLKPSSVAGDLLCYHRVARQEVSGSNSVVECQLPKLDVAGSSPVSRSINPIVRTGDIGNTLFLRHGWVCARRPHAAASSSGRPLIAASAN
jgi:hypothetical protein